MITTTSNYNKKTNEKLIIGGQDVVMSQDVAAPLLGTAIYCDDGWFQVTVLFTRRTPVAPMYVLGGVRITAKRAAELTAIYEIKKELEAIAYGCPRFSGSNADEIHAVRAQFDTVRTNLNAFDAKLVADCYQGSFAGNGRPGVWTRPSHLIGE